MKEGAVVRIALPQSDHDYKHRPGVALKKLPPYDDWLVCGISTSLNLEVKGFDVLVDKSHPDFQTMGLKFPSLIRLGFLGTIPLNLIEGTLGEVSHGTHQQLLRNLKNYL